MMKVFDELELLKPAAPHTHDDDLPVFNVTAVDIFYQDEQTLESLLNANEEKPLILVGRLLPINSDKRHLCETSLQLTTRYMTDDML